MKKVKFYKQISILFIVFLLSLGFIIFIHFIHPQEISAQTQVCCSTATITFSGNFWTYGELLSNPVWITDNDTTTSMGAYGYGMVPHSTGGVLYNIYITLDEPSNIETVTFIHQGTIYGGQSMPTDQDVIRTYLYYNNTWNVIDSRSANTGMALRTAVINSGGTPWTNVSAIRIESIVSRNWSGSGAISHINEVSVSGAVVSTYQDIGLRVRNDTQTVAIAAEVGPAVSPLRIAKNGTVYGIALVDPGDPNESGVRIQTSSGIKALRKYPQ